MEQISEAEISMVLDTFMYLNYQQAADGTSIREILKELEQYPAYREGGSHFGEYTIIAQAAENDEIGELVIGCQSVNMGYDTGTAACTFSSPDADTFYVVYRGTGDGEWPDNGIGMTEEVTTQQERALQYFEEVVDTTGAGKDQRLVITGHSKGGNKAQFVTMETQYGDRIDACYSVDGQGFSPKAVKRWQNKYGKSGFEERTKKIQGIHGENDYVSALGYCIIPRENIRYVRTPAEKGNFAGYHDIKYMFAKRKEDLKTGEYTISFQGRKNAYTPERGPLGEYAAALSAGVMALPGAARDGCAAVVMQVMESLQGTKTGLNGEKLTLFDFFDFTSAGVPVIVSSLLLGERGRELLGAVIGNEDFGGQLSGKVNLELTSDALAAGQSSLYQAAFQITNLTGQINEVAGEIPSYMKGSMELYRKLRLSAETMERLEKKLKQLIRIHEGIEINYRKWEEQAAETASSAIAFLQEIQ